MVSRSPTGGTQRSAAGQATVTSVPRQSPFARAAILASAFLLPALTLTACAAPTHYAGIDLRAGAADAEVQALAQQARGGSKEAQLALGIRYEEGRGVPLDVKRARKLYRMAAATTGGAIYVYVPATRKGGKGYVTSVNTGPRVEGLSEAKEKTFNNYSSESESSLKLRLERLVNCIRDYKICSSDDSISSFEAQVASISTSDLRARLIRFLNDPKNSLSIVKVTKHTHRDFVVKVEYALHDHMTCGPSVEDDLGQQECVPYESTVRSIELWHVSIAASGSMGIVIGRHPRLSGTNFKMGKG